MHLDQAQNTLSGIQGQEATALAVIYVTAPLEKTADAFDSLLVMSYAVTKRKKVKVKW